MRSGILSLVALAVLIVPTSSWARLLQIIHTNDLHSHFEHADDLALGGYGAVKATIDALRADAENAGTPVLVLDGGDFSEGTQFYLSNDGVESWKILDQMGYDTVAIGNHDWLVGLDQIEEILSRAQPHVPFVSANFNYSSKYQQIARHIHPYSEFVRDGIKIAVLGLSTDEFVYKWRVTNGFISPPQAAAARYIPELKTRNDFIIALTHLGVDADQQLVKAAPGIDLVVGGHSHTALFDPVFQTNPEGRTVPIVQAGMHGEYVGDLLVDLEPGKPLQIIRYRLIPVHSDGPADAQVVQTVQQARSQLEDKFGRDWLYEPVTYSEIPVENPVDHPTFWGDIVAQAVQETAQADMSLDVGEFFGGTQPPGPVTREHLFQFYPRTFDLHRPYGWTIWRVDLSGWLIKLVMQIAHDQGRYLNVSGLTYDVDSKSGQLKNFKINGKPLAWWWIYRVGVTEGIGRAASDISFLIKLFVLPHDTGVPVWSAVEQKVRSMGPIIQENSTLR